MYERPESNLELTRKKLEHANRFYAENDLTETVHYIWVIFENCINIVKDIKNNAPLYKHRSKIDLFSIYYSLGILKKDYSSTFAILVKLRIRADFGEYSQVPKIPGKEKIKEYLDETTNLFKETEQIVKGLKR